MNPEENDALWKLLGTASRKPEITPTFAQNVTRQARQIGKSKAGFWRNLFYPENGVGWSGARSALVACVLVACVSTAIVFLNRDNATPDTEPVIVVVDPPTFPETVSEVDPVLEGFENEMDRIDQFDALLTVGDVDDLADEEIAMLLF